MNADQVEGTALVVDCEHLIVRHETLKTCQSGINSC